MKRNILRGAVCAALASSAALVATGAGAAGNWYVEGDLGASRTRLDNGDVAGSFAGLGAGGGSIDRNDSGWGLKLGYRMNPNWGVEAAYNEFGKFGYSTTTTTPAGSISGDYKPKAFSLSGLGFWPLGTGSKWSLYGKVGLARTELERNVGSASAGLGAGSAKERNTGLVLGLGANYDISERWFARVGWDRFTRLGDTGSTGRGDLDYLNAGVGFRF